LFILSDNANQGLKSEDKGAKSSGKPAEDMQQQTLERANL